MYDDYIYGSVIATPTTIANLETLIASNDVIYFNYAVYILDKVQVTPGNITGAIGVKPQYLFDPSTSLFRLHILSSPDNILTNHPTYVSGVDTFTLEGFVWLTTNNL